MSLRARLLVGVLATALPVALVATAVQSRRELDRSGELVRERTYARLEAIGREACEADAIDRPPLPFADEDPEDWLFDEPPELPPEPPPHREPAGVRHAVFDARLRPLRPDAPRIPPRAAREVRRGRPSAAWIDGDRRGRAPRIEHVLLRTPWDSPRCAFVVVSRPMPRPPGLGSRLVAPLSVTLAVVVAVLVVAGPVVERIRRLTRQVREGGAYEDERGNDEIAELARAFRERERTIAAQLDALAAREAALREHLAATSHDVLLPITVLAGHLAAVDEAAREGRPAPTDAVRGALEETEYVTSLVRDLNAEARLRSGSPEVRIRLDLAVIVARVAGRHRMLAERAGIALEFAVPESEVPVLADPTLVEQLVSNLVNNAVRHGRSGGHVAVILSMRSGRFVLEVLDDGPGVPSQELARLGERGFRTDEARTRRPDGMGLGLHIAREVAAAHGHALTFAANEPSGLRARLEGPTEEAAAPSPDPSPLLRSDPP